MKKENWSYEFTITGSENDVKAAHRFMECAGATPAILVKCDEDIPSDPGLPENEVEARYKLYEAPASQWLAIRMLFEPMSARFPGLKITIRESKDVHVPVRAFACSNGEPMRESLARWIGPEQRLDEATLDFCVGYLLRIGQKYAADMLRKSGEKLMSSKWNEDVQLIP